MPTSAPSVGDVWTKAAAAVGELEAVLAGATLEEKRQLIGGYVRR